VLKVQMRVTHDDREACVLRKIAESSDVARKSRQYNELAVVGAVVGRGA
jgi:hypothetical protein